MNTIEKPAFMYYYPLKVLAWLHTPCSSGNDVFMFNKIGAAKSGNSICLQVSRFWAEPQVSQVDLHHGISHFPQSIYGLFGGTKQSDRKL